MKNKVSNKTAASSVASSSVAPATPVVPSISAADVETFVNAIDAFAHLLGEGFVVPQPEVVKRMPKARKEAPTIVPMVADISNRYQVLSAAYPIHVMLAKQQIANTLSPVAERIAAVQKLVGSIMTAGQSGAWEGAMVTYSLLKTEARGNAVLRNALVPVREKLRPTYQTEAGGKTKVRSRSKSATAKGAATPKTPKAKGGASAASPAVEVPPEAVPAPPAVVAPEAPSATPVAKA